MSLGSAATADAAWSEVAERLEAFVAAWEAGAEPALDDHLPPEADARRRLVLVELVKADLEFRARGGRPPRIEDYLAAHPELADADGPPVELLCEEYHVRRSHGASADVADLCRRFPGRADELRRWLGAACSRRQAGHVMPTCRVLPARGSVAFPSCTASVRRSTTTCTCTHA